MGDRMTTERNRARMPAPRLIEIFKLGFSEFNELVFYVI